MQTITLPNISNHDYLPFQIDDNKIYLLTKDTSNSYLYILTKIGNTFSLTYNTKFTQSSTIKSNIINYKVKYNTIHFIYDNNDVVSAHITFTPFKLEVIKTFN